MKILAQLDVQGFEEQMEVIKIKYARAKDISELVDQIINGDKKSSQFGGVPRFRPAGETTGGSTGSEVYKVVVPDDRTNSIIVVGNKAGIEKIRHLVARLDFPMRPDEQGGFHVYYLRHAEAEPLANIINGIAGESKKAIDQANQAKTPQAGIGPGGIIQSGPAATAIFGGDVKVSPDKSTNSLVIVASKQDYETVSNLIAKIDIAKDQVFIKTVIMEMTATNTDQWGINYYKFGGDPAGIGRIGFRGGSIDQITNPANDSGGILGFGSGGTISMTIAGTPIQVPSLSGLINILKQEGMGNVLSTPQITALNNEESTIEVGSKVPVSKNDTATAAGAVTSNITREPVTTKMVITPYISPDTDEVKLKIDQDVADLAIGVSLGGATELAKNAVVTTTRKIKTSIVVNSGDTAVLGGLMKDRDQNDVTKIPVLGDIPIIGWLFKSEKTTKEKDNLMVFITPKIIRTASEAAEIVENKINERITFIKQSMNGRDPHGQYIDELPRHKSSKAPPEKSPPQEEAPAVESF
jgi:general secretion pathway protein D